MVLLEVSVHSILYNMHLLIGYLEFNSRMFRPRASLIEKLNSKVFHVAAAAADTLFDH